MGTSVTPAVGQLQLTGLAPVTDVARSYLVHRLVIPGVGSTFAPGDIDPLPDTDFYITSKRGIHHPWIAQASEGPEAGPDISVGGQKLDLPLGRSTDGEVQIRLIDVAAPIAAVACDINSILVAEGNADLDSNAFTTGGWTGHSSVENDPANVDGAWYPDMDILGGVPAVVEGALFFWIDQPPYPGDPAYPRTIGPWVREVWMERTFNGTEGGGAAWTPGQIVGFHARVNWSLNSGTPKAFIEVEGAGDPVRVSGLAPGFDFWSIPVDPGNNQVDSVVYTTADALGEVTVRMGAEVLAPSFNIIVSFSDLEFVSCTSVVVASDEERYITGWLADSAARQQLLGRPAYLEESLDGGATWSRVLYRGYLKQITLDQSLTYLLTLGDAGRGRRVSKAWTDLNPVEEFAP